MLVAGYVFVSFNQVNDEASEFFEGIEGLDIMDYNSSSYSASVSGASGSDLDLYSENNVSYIRLDSENGGDLYWSTGGDIRSFRNVDDVSEVNNRTVMDTRAGSIIFKVDDSGYIESISGLVSYSSSRSNKPDWVDGEKSITSYGHMSGAPGLNIEEFEDFYEMTIIHDNSEMPHTFVYYNCEEMDVRSTGEGSFMLGSIGSSFMAPKNDKCDTKVIGLSGSNTVHLLAGFSD